MKNCAKSLKKAFFLNLIAVGIIITLAFNACGDTLCYDNFSGDSSGWGSGSIWDGNLTVITNTSVTPLIYSNAFVYVNGGDTAISVTKNVDGGTSEYFKRAMPTRSNTFYISFLARYNESSLSSWDFIGCGQKASGADAGAALGHAGTSLCAGTVYINDGNINANLGSANPRINTTYLMVAKYTWDALEEKFSSITAYLNPLSATNESAEFSATVSGAVTNFASIDFQYYGSKNVDFDEIRVGRTWADVVPAAPSTPEEPSAYSVTVTLSPAAAITAGARWALAGELSTWRDSGTSVDLTNGTYTVEFQDATGYLTPGDYELTVNGDDFSYEQKYMEETPPPKRSNLNCYDGFSGNETGWDSGTAWSGGTTFSTNTSVSPLVYSNHFVYVNGGDTAISITENVRGGSSHAYSRAIPKQTNTFYMSYLARFKAPPDGAHDYNYIALGQKSSYDSGAALGKIAGSSGIGFAFMNDESNVQNFSSTLTVDQTYLIVAKYIWNGSAFTSMTAYLNPTSTVAELAQQSATVSGTLAEDFDSADFQYYGDSNVDFDEVRVGRTWADVVPAALSAPAPTNYSVTVTLSPAEAITAGAQWALASESSTWRDSGTSVDLTNGTYTVEFHGATGYVTPGDYELTVNGAAVSHTQTYTEDIPLSQTLSITLLCEGVTQCVSQWGIVSGSATNWHDSGDSVVLDPATYHVVYSGSFQSRKPSSEDITLSAGEALSLTRYYTQAVPLSWQSLPEVDIGGLGNAQSATNNSGLLGSYFGVTPVLQTVRAGRLNGSITISESAELIGSLDRPSRPQDQTWVFDWRSLQPTLRTNTTDWGECDWIGPHTPSIGFDLPGSDPYGSKVEHTDPHGNVSTNNFYPSGGEYYDMEGVYFDNDAEYFYISVISSAPFSNEWINAEGTLCRDLGVPEVAASHTNAVVPTGDIAFDFGLNTPVSENNGATFSYDFGIDLTHEVRDSEQWFTLHSSFSYQRPPNRDLDTGTGLYRTQNTDWYLALDSGAAVNAGGEHTNFDPDDASSSAIYRGEVQSSVYRLDFPEGRLENDLPTYVYEFVVPRALFNGAETNRNYIKMRFLPTTCRNDGNNEEHVFYLNNIKIDQSEPGGYGAIGNRAWLDKNKNGLQDDDENDSGISNVRVVAVSQNTGVAFTNYTDALGFYLFDHLPAGYYNVYFEKSDDYKFTIYNQNPLVPERGHNVDDNISGITNVYVTAGVTNLNVDVGLVNVNPMSSGIDLRAYRGADGVYVEFIAYDVEQEGRITLFLVDAAGNEIWSDRVAVQAGDQRLCRFKAPGLIAGKVYDFRVRDEVGKLWSASGVKVGEFATEMIEMSFEGITLAFDSLPDRDYEIQWTPRLGQSWQSVTNVPSRGERTTVVVAPPDPRAPSGFFRVITQ